MKEIKISRKKTEKPVRHTSLKEDLVISELRYRKAELELAESEIKFRSFFENSRDAILLTGKNDKILSANNAACCLFGYDADELTELGLTKVEDKTDIRLSVLMSERALKGNAKGEVTFLHKNGSRIPAEISTSVFKNYEGEYLSGMIIHDISDRKQREKQLIEAKEEAEHNNNLKTAFLANMSHEIRTPMNGIIGFAELLKEPFLTEEQQKEYIDIIEKSGFRLLNIINDLISISKIESGIIDNRISAFNINNLVEDVYNSYKAEAELKNIKMSFLFGLPEDQSIINSDKDKVYAILTNLIKNAIKFTNEGSIEFGYWKNKDNLNFFVRDTGIGVQQDRMEIIFERFIQGSELLIRNYEGAGLGLSISKGYVTMLGGRIWVENNMESSRSSIDHSGSVFFFTLPYCEDRRSRSLLYA